MDVIRINWQKYTTKSVSLKDGDCVKLCIDTSLLPIIHSLHIENNTIYYHEGMEVHLLLMNLARTSPELFLKLAVLYEFISICLEYRYLDSAKRLIEKLKEEIIVVKKIEKLACSPIDLDLQFDFFVGHECAHYLYQTNSVLRDESKNEIIELTKLYLMPKNLIQLLCYRKTREMFNDDLFIEELSSDRNSIIYFDREIPPPEIIETIHQISQLLCMLQLHNNLEELIEFSLFKGLSRHLIKLNLDVIRGCIVTKAILEKYEQVLYSSEIDSDTIKKVIREDYYYYNSINNKLLSMWFSDNYLYTNMINCKTDYSNQNRFENLKTEFEDVIMDFVNHISI